MVVAVVMAMAEGGLDERCRWVKAPSPSLPQPVMMVNVMMNDDQ